MEKKQIIEKAKTEYNRWLTLSSKDLQLHSQLEAMADNEEELVDAFYTDLRFGTSGIRGIIGPGTNRMNEYVVRRTTRGLANYLNNHYPSPSVVIAYDSRQKSKVFAEETAKTLQQNKIKAFLFPELAPVSLLCYAIEKLQCTMGIMITASHNPKYFNGYKVYNSHGYQIVGEEPDLILAEIDKLDYFDESKGDSGEIEMVSSEISEAFIAKISSMSLAEKDKSSLSELSVVYTPLNGTGNQYVREVLRRIGAVNVTVVASQEQPDQNFTTCPAPNPEKITAYSEGFRVLDQIKGDLIVATDPDCDRVGVCIYHDGMKVLLTGNQLGILLFDYLCQKRTPLPGQMVVKSIVTTPLIDQIAKKYGLKVVNTLTGFKYIGEIITNLDREGNAKDYFFGFEESNGYLADPFIRDKDGVSSAMLAVEMAAWHKSNGKDLIDRLHEIYDEFGKCIDKTRNYFFEGPYGRLAMEALMEHFRTKVENFIGEFQIKEKVDYLEETGLPKSDVIEFVLTNGSRFLIRPSGTESKIKVYLFEAQTKSQLEDEIEAIIFKFP